MMKSRILVSALFLCSLVSMSFGQSMFFDAQQTLGGSANWNDPTAWYDYNVSGNCFNSVPTTGDWAFLMNGCWNGTGDDPANDQAIVNSDAVAYGMQIGYWGQAATLNVQDGANLNISTQSTIGANGQAVVNQNGGTFTSDAVRIGGGNDATVSLSGGQMTARTGGFVVGDSSSGTVTMNQTGGTVTVGGSGLAIGKSGATGIYNMTGGTIEGLKYQNYLQIGAIGAGTASVRSELNLGDAESTGTIKGDLNTCLLIDSRNSMLHGWGLFDLGGKSTSSASRLWNDGVVKADGYGVDRNLDLSQFNHVECYSTQNTGSNGWYAVNHGALLLPSVAVAAGNGSYNWGEDAYFTSPDLVNAFTVNFTNASAGNLVAKLLAEDRTDVAAHEGHFLAVWQIDSLACDSASLIFRFDDAQAAALGMDMSKLAIAKWNGSAWVNLPGTIDLANKTITITADGNIGGTYAVVPEPATLILLGLGGVLLRKKSR